MITRRCAFVLAGIVPMLGGCAGKRVHVMPEVSEIHRVAVVNLADRTGKASPESEFFTNEFVSVGFSVVERGHLQDVIKEAFTETGYLDERSVAQWGRGLGVEGVVLHQILTNSPAGKDQDTHELTGWVRLVDVETGKIVLTYNTEFRAAGVDNPTRAAKAYAERVVDDIREALKQKNIRPAAVSKVQIIRREAQQSTITTQP